MRKSCRDLKKCQLRGLDEPAHPKARIMDISRSSCDMVSRGTWRKHQEASPPKCL